MMDYRIHETIRADGTSDWSVDFHNGRNDYAPEDRWKRVCTVESKKKGVQYIQNMRGGKVVDHKYHEVPL